MFSQTRTRSPERDQQMPRKSININPLTVPVGNVLVSDTGGNIEHDDTALAVDVVSITQTTELLLSGSIPNIELDGAQVLFFSLDYLHRRARRDDHARRTVVNCRG